MAHLRVDRHGSGRPRTRSDRVRADKAYASARSAPNYAAAASGSHRRAPPTKQHTGSDAVPRADDHHDSTPRTTATATVIERGFNAIKQWRGLATRYDKLAIVYRAAVVLHGVITWTAHLSDTP